MHILGITQRFKYLLTYDKISVVKHQTMEHGGEPPEFHMRVVSYHRTALNRQVKEAVRIRRRGGASSILNSRAEYNRCHIPRLVLEEEEEQTTKEREMEKLLNFSLRDPVL